MGKQPIKPKKKSLMDSFGDVVKTTVRKADSLLSASKPIGTTGRVTITPLKSVKKAPAKKKY